MDDDMDDFGDLYGDLEDRVNAGIPCVQENQYSRSADRTISSLKRGGFDSINGEHNSDDRIGEGNARPLASNRGMESLAFGVDESRNSSDSEDDLRIVLNEDDCSKMPPSQRANLGNGGLAVGEGQGEEEDEDLVNLYGTDCPQKNLKWGDRLSSPTWDGAGSNPGGFLYTGKTSVPGRGDRDQLMMLSSEASCNLSIPASAQNGYSFTLPRNRTIFDISIEAFEQKPWRQPQVDITDYFNFGLDEDSWEIYCKNLGQFRQQVFALDYNLSRLNQVDSELGSPKAMLSKAAQWGHKEKCFLDMGNVEERLMGLQMPKGRAIQVESGVGERTPSIDIRQPRYGDSDVVIQIAMDDCMKDVSIPCVGELEHAEQGHVDCSMLECQNEPNEGMLSLDHDDQRCWETTNPLMHCYPGVAKTSLRGAAEEVKAKLEYSKVHLILITILNYPRMMSVWRTHDATRKPSLDAVTGLQNSVLSDCYLSNDSIINATKTELEDIKGNTYDCCFSPEGYKGWNTCGHSIMADLNIPAEDEQAFIQSSRKCQNDVGHFEARGTRERKCHHITDMGGHLSSNKETKMPKSYKSIKYAEKHASEKSSTKAYHKKGDHDTPLWRNHDERDFLLEKRPAGRDYSIKHHERYSHEWCHDDQGVGVVHCEHFDKSISEYGSFFLGKDSSMGHKKERENEHIIRTDAVNYDSMTEHRYREKHVQEMHKMYLPKCNRKEEVFDHRLCRPAPCSGRGQRTPERRDKFDESSCFDLYGSNKYIEYDAKRLRHIDGRLLDSQTYEHHVEDERGWHDTSPPRNRLPVSWRFHEKFVDHRKHFAIREIQSMCKKYEWHFVPSSKDCHHLSDENGNKFDYDAYITEERGTYIDDIDLEKRYGWLAKPRLRIDDKVSFWHQESYLLSRKGSFLCEGSPRHEKSLINQHFVAGRKFSDDCRLGNAEKGIINERNAASDAREHNKFVLHNFDKQRHELATLGCRDAFNMCLNGLERKFRKRGSGVTVASERRRDVVYTVDKEKTSRHVEAVNMLEVPLHIPKSDRTLNHPTNLKKRVKELKSEEHSGDHFVKKCEDKHPISQGRDDNEIEEGQLIEESDDQHMGSTTKDWNRKKEVAFPTVAASRRAYVEEKNMQAKESTPDNKIFVGYDSNRILETLAKMEKHRERFKEPIALKQGPAKTLNSQLEVAAVTDEVNQQGPARKRRWGEHSSEWTNIIAVPLEYFVKTTCCIPCEAEKFPTRLI
ncbi:FIP1[III]-like protein [Cocos nucifera]|uniref:FIP1[III]-like protein n=1 Tax=Cocos nucifera TaxID=13894 RepID=A0A8K0IYK1_COCNU|nr:FIP1[III]-like protein [Cocos nucifera]